MFFYDDIVQTIEARVDLRSQASTLEKVLQDTKAVAAAIGTRYVSLAELLPPLTSNYCSP